MANTPKKIKDPTEAALSAIQDALSIRDEPSEPQSATGSSSESNNFGAAPDDAQFEPPWRTVRSTAPETEHLDAEVSPPEEQGLLRRPANDDRESIGQILRSLQRRPARTSYMIATVFAVAWVLAGLALGWMYLPQLEAAVSPTGLTAPFLAVLGAIFLAPIIFFYVLAHWRGARRSCGSSRNRWLKWRCAWQNPKRLPANPLSLWARRSGARSPPWATA